MVNNLPVNAGDAEDVGLIPGWEDPLEEGMATHSSILAWSSMDIRSWQGGVHGVTKSQTQISTHTHTHTHTHMHRLLTSFPFQGSALPMNLPLSRLCIHVDPY